MITSRKICLYITQTLNNDNYLYIFKSIFSPKLTFVVVKKRGNTRLYQQSGQGFVNPPIGTVVDSSIVKDKKYVLKNRKFFKLNLIKKKISNSESFSLSHNPQTKVQLVQHIFTFSTMTRIWHLNASRLSAIC